MTVEKKKRETSPKKPGWQTSEFWGYFAAAMIDFAIANGFIAGDESWPVKVLICAAATLAALGYGQQRTSLKRSLIAQGK